MSTHSVELHYVFFCQSLQIRHFYVICNTTGRNRRVSISSILKTWTAHKVDLSPKNVPHANFKLLLFIVQQSVLLTSASLIMNIHFKKIRNTGAQRGFQS